MSESEATTAGAVTDGEERLVTGATGRLLLVTVIGTMSLSLSQLVLPPLLPTIIDDLSITPLLAGTALTVLWALTALLQFPGGRASDQLSRKTVLLAALGSIILGGVILSGTVNYPTFVLGAAAIGIGAGLYHPSGFALLADLFTRRRGAAFGMNAGFTDLGGVLAAVLAGLVLATATWRLAFLPIIGVAGLAALAQHRWNAEPYRVARVDLKVRSTFENLFAAPRIRWLVVAFSLFMFVWQGTTSFLPTFLQVEKGFSTALANNAFAIFFLSGVIVKPTAGRVGDRLGHARVAAGASVLATVALGFMVLADSQLGLIGSIVFFAVGLGAFWPVTTAYLMDNFQGASMGGDLGGLRTISFALGSLGSTYVGFMVERVDYATAYSGFVACLAASIVILLWLAMQDD